MKLGLLSLKMRRSNHVLKGAKFRIFMWFQVLRGTLSIIINYGAFLPSDFGYYDGCLEAVQIC